MYELVNNKDKSIKDYIKFLDFMIDNSKYTNSDDFKYDKADFNYHYLKIPVYTREVMQKLRYDLIEDVASIGLCTERLSKRINEFTEL